MPLYERNRGVRNFVPFTVNALLQVLLHSQQFLFCHIYNKTSPQKINLPLPQSSQCSMFLFFFSRILSQTVKLLQIFKVKSAAIQAKKQQKTAQLL